jgi:hypothetical protein
MRRSACAVCLHGSLAYANVATQCKLPLCRRSALSTQNRLHLRKYGVEELLSCDQTRCVKNVKHWQPPADQALQRNGPDDERDPASQSLILACATGCLTIWTR